MGITNNAPQHSLDDSNILFQNRMDRRRDRLYNGD